MRDERFCSLRAESQLSCKSVRSAKLEMAKVDENCVTPTRKSMLHDHALFPPCVFPLLFTNTSGIFSDKKKVKTDDESVNA